MWHPCLVPRIRNSTEASLPIETTERKVIPDEVMAASRSYKSSNSLQDHERIHDHSDGFAMLALASLSAP